MTRTALIQNGPTHLISPLTSSTWSLTSEATRSATNSPGRPFFTTATYKEQTDHMAPKDTDSFKEHHCQCL